MRRRMQCINDKLGNNYAEDPMKICAEAGLLKRLPGMDRPH